jgi:hypothetical protein
MRWLVDHESSYRGASFERKFQYYRHFAGDFRLNFFGGAVQTDSSRHVTGTVPVNRSFFLCFGIQLDLPLAGAIDSTGKLNATITSSNGQTITLSAGRVSRRETRTSRRTPRMLGTTMSAQGILSILAENPTALP